MSFKGMLAHRCTTKRWYPTGTTRWGEPARELRTYLQDVPCLAYSPRVRELNRTGGRMDVTDVWVDLPPDTDVVSSDRIEFIGDAAGLFGYDTFEVIGMIPAGGTHHRIVRVQQVTT